MKKSLLILLLFYVGAILGAHENSLLYSAVKAGKKNEVIRHLDNGVDLNQQNEENKTALHCAAENKNIEMVKILIHAGAYLDPHAYYGWTPLHWAVYVGSLDVVKLLIESGADIDRNNNYEYNALGLAVYYDKVKIAQTLACHGAKIAFGHRDGLHSALSFSDKIEMLQLLIDLGANVNYQDSSKKTALHKAVEAHNFKKVEFLLQAGSLTDIQDKDGLIAVDFAKNDRMKKLLRA